MTHDWLQQLEAGNEIGAIFFDFENYLISLSCQTHWPGPGPQYHDLATYLANRRQR